MSRGDFVGGLNPGRLRRKINIEAYTRTRDTDGAVIMTPYTFASPFADIQPLQGTEKDAAQQIVADAQYIVTIRYAPNVTAQMRVNCGTTAGLTWNAATGTWGSMTGTWASTGFFRQFEILDVKHDENRHTRTDLFCRELNRS